MVPEFFNHTRRCLGLVLKAILDEFQQRANKGVYAIHFDCYVGFWAQINYCMWVFYYCKAKSLRPYVVLSSSNYASAKGDNWFEYFFDNKALLEQDKKDIERDMIKISTIRFPTELLYFMRHGTKKFSFGLNAANKLMNEFIQIKPGILNDVELFIKQKFRQQKTLGIHYRGTDKMNEAPRVSAEYCMATMRNYLQAHPEIKCIFVASDETTFIKRIAGEFKEFNVVSYDDMDNTHQAGTLHLAFKGNNYTKGKDALMNCLLLSRCDALIKTASFLSAWACVFNPNLPVIVLNQPYDGKCWFPDREVIKKSMANYLPAFDRVDTNFPLKEWRY